MRNPFAALVFPVHVQSYNTKTSSIALRGKFFLKNDQWFLGKWEEISCLIPEEVSYY